MKTEEDPKKALGLRLAHVGINGGTPENAEKITRQLATLLGLGTTELAPSYFVDTYIEIMKGAGRGEKGHIGFHVDDIDAAQKALADAIAALEKADANGNAISKTGANVAVIGMAGMMLVAAAGAVFIARKRAE